MRTNTGKNIKLKTGKSNLDIVKSYLNGEKAFVQVGYDPNLENSNRKEGEEWKDDVGNKWIKKNGVVKKIPKKASIIVEQRCNHCNADVRFGNYLDDQVWPKTRLCYDCFIEEETNMKIMGIWNEFNELRNLRNEKSMINDIRQKFEESKKWVEDNRKNQVSFVEEDGSIEKWEGLVDYDKIYEDVNADLKVVYERLSVIDDRIRELELIYESAKSKRNNKIGV
jgi:hypothetical protein